MKTHNTHNKNKLVVMMATLLAAPALNAAVIIGDFEGGSLDDWGSAAGSAPITTLTTSTVGATVGSGSLQVALDGGYSNFAFGVFQKDISEDTAARGVLAADGSTVTIDITADAANITGVMNLRFLVNGDTGGNEQLPIQAVNTDGTTYTMTFEPTANQRSIIANSDTFLFVGFTVTGGSGARTFHVDNIQAIPEPGTLSLFSVCGGALLFRRRRMKM